MTAQGFTDQGSTTSDNLLAGEFPRIAELATVSGGKYARGTILGKITARGKCTICTSAATDGSKDAYAVLAEAGMSYLGIGVQPPDASLGRMLSEAQTYFRAGLCPVSGHFYRGDGAWLQPASGRLKKGLGEAVCSLWKGGKRCLT